MGSSTCTTITNMTPPFMGAGRLCRSGTFYAQAAYNVLICAAVLFVHLFLFWLAFEHDVAAVWTDFALSRNAFLGLATLAPILGYMLWVDGVLVPLFVVVWAVLTPVGFNFQGAEDAALHPPIGFVLLMWPAKFLLGSSTVGAAFLFLSELSIALPFCLRYLFFGLPREVIACLGHGFLSLVSVALCGCCCGGRGARVRPYYSRLTGLEKRKTSSRGRDAWVRYRDVDRYETEGNAFSCCEVRVGEQGDGSHRGEVLRPVKRRSSSTTRCTCTLQSEEDQDSKMFDHPAAHKEETPAVLGALLWDRLLRVVRRQNIFMYDSALRYSEALENAILKDDKNFSSERSAPSTRNSEVKEEATKTVFERLHSDMARVHQVEQRRRDIKIKQLATNCCGGFRAFCARVVQLVTTILELLLIPMVIVPFALERLLFRYVDESGNHSHYIVMLHGMGANSANYLYARYFFGVHGLTTTVIYINWLSGPFLLSYSGNVEEITDDVVAQVRARLERIQAGRERLALGSKRSSSVQKGRSSGEKLPLLEGTRNRDPPAHDLHDDRRITVSLVGHSCGGLLTVQLASRLFGVGTPDSADVEKDALTRETLFPSPEAASTATESAVDSPTNARTTVTTSSVRNRLGSQTLEAPPGPQNEEDETRPVARKEELFPAPLSEKVGLYSIASISGPFCGSDTVLWLYRTFPESLLKPLLGGGNALHIDLLPRSEQTADLSRTLARIVARGRAGAGNGNMIKNNGKSSWKRKSTSTHLLRGGAHFFGGSGDFLVYPYSAFGLMFPTNDHGTVENFYPAAVTLESVAANTSFAVLTNLGHYNIAVSATLWRSILSRVVVREVQ